MSVIDQDCAYYLLGALDRSHIGVAICDKNYRFQAINNTLARMNGLPPNSHLGKTIHDVLGPAARVIEPVMSRVMTMGKPVTGLQLEAQLANRKDVGHWIEDYFPVMDSKGQVTKVCALVIEITREKLLERSLQSLRTNALAKLFLTAVRTHKLLERQSRILRQAAKKPQGGSIVGLGRALDELQVTLTESIAAIASAEAQSARRAEHEHEGDQKGLSQREREVVRFLCKGKSNKELARILNISVKTVETHRSRSMNKLGLGSLAELVRYAIRNGIVEA